MLVCSLILYNLIHFFFILQAFFEERWKKMPAEESVRPLSKTSSARESFEDHHHYAPPPTKTAKKELSLNPSLPAVTTSSKKQQSTMAPLQIPAQSMVIMPPNFSTLTGLDDDKHIEVIIFYYFTD
jgi:hypothetical protein